MLIFHPQPNNMPWNLQDYPNGGGGGRGRAKYIIMHIQSDYKGIHFPRVFQYANILHKVPLGLLFVFVS
jgi:hypothetical protein